MDFLRPLKEEKADFTTKIMANVFTMMAHLHNLEGKTEEAAQCLREVLVMVQRFDATPDYGIQTFSYPVFHNDVIVNDGLGATAADSIETILRLLDNQELSQMWKEMTDDGQ